MEKVVILGSGPAAHTAAIYAARANLEPLLFEGQMAGGVAAGGQLTTTTLVENFPGFPQGVQGPELMDRMREQSLHCQARIKTKTVVRVDLSRRPFSVTTDDNETVKTQALIIATGATAKRLAVPGEERLWQKGVSACAVCDGPLPVFRQKDLVVVGGGDVAAEEALYLTAFAKNIFVIHRRDQLRASKVMQERLMKNDKIKIVWNTVVVEAMGEKFLNAVRLQDVTTKETREFPCAGLFYAIGHQPNTGFLNGQLELDAAGYVKTVPGATRTNVPGVFACGDVQDKIYRQAITAAGSGCMAALEAERFFLEKG